MRAQATAFALWSSRNKWFGGVLYATRKEAEQALVDFNAGGESVSAYDGVIELAGEVETKDPQS